MPADTRLLTREETEKILKNVRALLAGGGRSMVMVCSQWTGELRWARNRASMTSDRRTIQVFVSRDIRGGRGNAQTNQTDPESLKGVVASAERQAVSRADQRILDSMLPPPVLDSVPATTWSDETFGRTIEQSATVTRQVTDAAEASGLMSAGYIEARGMSLGHLDIDPYDRSQLFYGQMTQAQCSVTVRDPKGSGSGWTGMSGYDIAKIDEPAIATRALEKCRASLNPVRVEPGRYTVILEPQAVADLVQMLIEGEATPMFRHAAEREGESNPFWLTLDEAVQRGRSRLGQRVVDERITISHDPSDPQTGVLPVPGVRPITWIKNGVLQEMTYMRDYALNELNVNAPSERRGGFRMSGGTTSVEQMIATTKRGFLVTRLSSLRLVDASSLLFTGLTRDGLWLIEDGKISKAVRNFRFTESPLFALNNVVDMGVPVPVFSPFPYPEFGLYFPTFALSQVVVPPIKVNDFSFTSTIDAV